MAILIFVSSGVALWRFVDQHISTIIALLKTFLLPLVQQVNLQPLFLFHVCLDVLHCPLVLLLLSTDHTILTVGLCRLGSRQSGVQAYQVGVLGVVVRLGGDLQIMMVSIVQISRECMIKSCLT